MAFLRGINVGKRRVTGADLEAAFLAAGCTGPSSYQAAGNIVFDDDRTGVELVDVLEATLESELGYEVRVILRSAEQVAELASQEPFSAPELEGAGKPQAILVAVHPSDADAEAGIALCPDGELLRFSDGVLWWLPAAGVLDSPLDMGALEGLVGLNTMRTKGTIERIAKKYCS